MALDLYSGKQASYLISKVLTIDIGRHIDNHNCHCRILVHLELSRHGVVAIKRRAGFHPNASQSRQ
jgi:hypothetical protein